jgi:TonB-linked SusC/RagA family outer membrane protein
MSLVLMLTLFQAVLAQTRAVSGRVIDQKTGEGLPGATVLLKGTTTGISTNADGNFTLTVPDNGGTLVISSVGMVTQEIPLGNRTTVSVSLATDNKQLTEVVVTGYGGSQDVKDITGSIATVKAEKLLLQPVVSVDQALQGRVAGLNVNTTSGTLGDVSAIRIRGANSLSNSSQPLVVLDGVPLNTTDQGNVLNTRYNPLADINPNDIASVEVLKDASASAIYGSRAANGVLVITTKRGKSGTNRVSVNSFYGLQQAVRTPKLLNGDDFELINNEKAANARVGSVGAPGNIGNTSIPAGGIAADIDVNGDGIPDRTDWIKEIFRTGRQQNYQAALSGGNEFATYYGSADWNDQQGIIIQNRLRRGSGRLSLDLTPKKWLKAGTTLSYAKTYNQGVNGEGALAGATVSGYTAPPNVPVYNPDGTYYLNNLGNLGNGNNALPGSYAPNAYYNIPAVLRLNRNDNTSERTLGNVYLTVIPLKGLSLTTKYGIDYNTNFEDQYSSPIIGDLGRAYNGLVQDYNTTRTQFNWQNYVNYDRVFADKHNVSLTAGAEYQETRTKRIYSVANDFADPRFQSILDNLSSGTLTGGGQEFNVGFQSYFARANYNFADKYYASFVIRSDASSVYGADNQRGYFPSGSVGWRISQESFLKNVTFLNDLKIRGSYGLVGNSNGLGSYAARTLIGGGRYTDLNGFSPTQVGNPELKWETSKKLDVGFDAAFLSNRLNVTFDYYNNNIDGLALAARVLATTGIPGTSITRNIGSMFNRGVELAINTTNVRMENSFTWSTNFNISVNRNRITALATPTDIISGNQRAQINNQLGVYFLPRWAGVNPANGNAMFLDANDNVKQFDAAYSANGTTNSGRWLTMNGDVTTAITTADYKYTDKTGYPVYYGGFDNTFSFKGVELGIFLQYSGGNLIYDGYRSALLSTSLQNNTEEIKNRWTTPGQETDIQKLVLRDVVSGMASTRWLEKGDFLRVRQLSLGYNFQQGVLNTLHLNNLRAYVLVQNVYNFTGYRGLDPEVNSNTTSTSGTTQNVAYGVDGRSLPVPRSFTFGLNLGI